MSSMVRYALMTRNTSPFSHKKPVEIIRQQSGKEYVTGHGYYDDLIAGGKTVFEPLFVKGEETDDDLCRCD